MNQLILLLAAATMVGAAIYLGQQGLALRKANKLLKAVVADLAANRMSHAAAPEGFKCADCTMDGEACPTCYAVWWKKRHPNTIQHGGTQT